MYEKSLSAEQFHTLSGLTVCVLVEVLGVGGPRAEVGGRPAVKATTDVGECVEFARRWLCLDASGDKETEPHWPVSSCRR